MRASEDSLTRRVDVVEARVLRVLTAVAVVVGTLAVVAGTFWIGGQGNASATPTSTVSRIIAETDAATKEATPSSVAIGSYGSTKVAAHWTWNGTERTGIISVPPNTPAGTEVPLTVDSNGAPSTMRPAPPSAAVMSTVAGFVLLGLTLVAYLGARSVVRRRFDDQRDRQWDHDLAVFYGQAI